MTDPNVNYEILPAGVEMDETDINVRSYFSRMSDARLQEYDASWSDDEVIRWDDNFTSDGNLFLVCSERDIEIDEYRRVLEEHRQLRGLAPAKS